MIKMKTTMTMITTSTDRIRRDGDDDDDDAHDDDEDDEDDDGKDDEQDEDDDDEQIECQKRYESPHKVTVHRRHPTNRGQESKRYHACRTIAAMQDDIAKEI